MNLSEKPGLLLPHGGYRKLRSYKVAEAVYDATVVFCRRFYGQDRRMTDQMVQAARSGVRNISEGSGMAATSRKSELKLTNVARASLSDELLGDFETFLRQRGLRVWPKDSREALAMRARLAQDHAPILPRARPGVVRLSGLFGLAEFVEKADPELAANAMLCAVNQAAYLLKRQIESQGETFLKKGGFTEKLYGARKRTLSDRSDKSDNPPVCPNCGQPMLLRTARTGEVHEPAFGEQINRAGVRQHVFVILRFHVDFLHAFQCVELVHLNLVVEVADGNGLAAIRPVCTKLSVCDVTRILECAQAGDPTAADQLLPLVYEELRKLAASKMANEAPGQTLQPTALVHEAWLRLGGSDQPARASSSFHPVMG